MRTLRVAVLILLTAPTWAADLADRARIPERDRRGVMVASLAPVALFPILPQFIEYTPPSAIVSGTTPITGGATTQVCYNQAGVIKCGDAGLVYNETTNRLDVTGVSGGLAIVLTANASLSLSQGEDVPIVYSTVLTPDNPFFGTSTAGRAWHFGENVDRTFDFTNPPCGSAACTDPTIVVHSAVQDTTSYHAKAAWGTARKYHVTLTESVATKVMQIPVAADVGTGGQIWYTIYATDGATPQSRFGRVIFALSADGAVETCTLGTPEEAVSSPVGTLTVTVTCDVATPTNAADIMLNAVSSLVQTTLEAYVSVDLIGPGQPARP